MRPPLRIAVLECDTPLENTNRRYNGYGGVFRALLSASAKALNRPETLDPESGLDISCWDIVNGDEYPKLEEIDAVLLTGSSMWEVPQPKISSHMLTVRYFPGHNSFDDIPWINRLVEFTQQVLAQDRVRILGICFGHQIVGRALGAKVGRSDQGWEIAVCEMDLTEKGKELFGREKIVRPWFSVNVPCRGLTRATNSASSKCTKTSSSTTRPTPSRWARRPAARCRGCTRRVGS